MNIFTVAIDHYDWKHLFIGAKMVKNTEKSQLVLLQCYGTLVLGTGITTPTGRVRVVGLGMEDMQVHYITI